MAATAITASCPLFWYLAVRPMSDLPGLAAALTAQACLLLAWCRQRPNANGDRRLTPAATAASGRMIVIGAFLSAISIGVRSQTMWLTVPLLVLVLFDRIGRGVAGALIGAGTMFVAGGLAWGIPLLVASGGLNSYLAALGTQAGEDFTAGEMLYLTRDARAAAFALVRTFVDPWDAPALAVVVLVLAALGLVYLLMRDRRSFAAVTAMTLPYLNLHLLFSGHGVCPLRVAARTGDGVSCRPRRRAGVGGRGSRRGGDHLDCRGRHRQSSAGGIQRNQPVPRFGC